MFSYSSEPKDEWGVLDDHRRKRGKAVIGQAGIDPPVLVMCRSNPE